MEAIFKSTWCCCVKCLSNEYSQSNVAARSHASDKLQALRTMRLRDRRTLMVLGACCAALFVRVGHHLQPSLTTTSAFQHKHEISLSPAGLKATAIRQPRGERTGVNTAQLAVQAAKSDALIVAQPAAGLPRPPWRECSAWCCVCVGLSIRFNTTDTSWGTATPTARQWWTEHDCHTVPSRQHQHWSELTDGSNGVDGTSISGGEFLIFKHFMG